MKQLILVLLVMLMAAGCGSSKKVTRLDPNTVTDLTGKWNDTDSRLVAEEMIADCLSRAWVVDFVQTNGTKPVVTVGMIRNKSDEHIDTEIFTKDFERELINSGKVKFVASPDQRDEVREERLDQQEFASRETAKKLREETGADYMLVGGVKSIVDQEGGVKVVFYQTDLELIHIESMEKAWIGTKKIKKDISSGKTKW
ncbi:MAG: penicillin-binding protein activator LpoB [bacterium]|nr:penicillin-binding protein activator LpoB [bacterium]